jgi:DNA-directed RNA polymerase subunit RPC12/RpoP
MIQRQCPQCSSELVPARRADQRPMPGIALAASPGWRCVVCGGEFTVDQIRKGNRARSEAIEHT